MKQLINFLKFFSFLLAATLISFLLLPVTGNDSHVAIIYMLSIFLISRYTTGYLWGILACLGGVMGINYFFTYPYFTLDFLSIEYPLSFLTLLTVSIITSTMTTRLEHQKQIAVENYKLAKQNHHLILETEKEKMRSNLLRAVSHDLRTPLTGIIGASQTYLTSAKQLRADEQNRLIEGIQEDADWLLHMVENLLSVTRIQQETANVTKTEESLEEVISEALFRFNKRYPNTNLNVVIPEDLILVPMDAMLIEQVIINLLENAYIHARSQQRIDLDVCTQPGRVVFSVKDYGSGIPPRQLPGLFDGSPALLDGKNDSRKGMGIGLSICKTIISAHGGQITAHNHDQGAAVIFWLPWDTDNQNYAKEFPDHEINSTDY